MSSLLLIKFAAVKLESCRCYSSPLRPSGRRSGFIRRSTIYCSGDLSFPLRDGFEENEGIEGCPCHTLAWTSFQCGASNIVSHQLPSATSCSSIGAILIYLCILDLLYGTAEYLYSVKCAGMALTRQRNPDAFRNTNARVCGSQYNNNS